MEIKSQLLHLRSKVASLEVASKAYHLGGTPIMSDAEFDKRSDKVKRQLQELHKTAPTNLKSEVMEIYEFFNRIGATPSARDKEELPIFMSSLNKVKTSSLDQLKKICNVLGNHILITPKLDGVGMLLNYRGGKLYKAWSRGDGYFGHNITPIAKAMASLGLIPESVDVKKLGVKGHDFFARTEVVMRKSKFSSKWEGKTTASSKTKLKNARNSVSGLINAHKTVPDLRFIKDLSVVVIDAWDEDGNNFGVVRHSSTKPIYLSKSEGLRALNDVGFTTIMPATYSNKDPSPFKQVTVSVSTFLKDANKPSFDLIRTCLDKAFAAVKDLDFDCDGLVFETDRLKLREKLGWGSDDRPKYAWAYKKDAKDEGADASVWTTVKEVEWNVSKSGALIPLVRLNPIQLKGVTISAATGNSAFGAGNDKVVSIKKWNLGKHSKVRIVRAGDVIPQIVEVAKGNKIRADIPTHCTSCGEVTTQQGPHLYCSKPSKCSGVVPALLTDGLRKLGVDGVGGGRVQKLYEAGFTELHKVASASPVRMAKIPGLGLPTATKIITQTKANLQKAPMWQKMEVSGCFIEPGFSLGGIRLEKLISQLGERKLAANPSKETVIKLLHVNGIKGSTADTFASCWPAWQAWAAKSIEKKGLF